MNPDWVALGSSRGIETEMHKLFMRLTGATKQSARFRVSNPWFSGKIFLKLYLFSVIFADLFVYIPAAIIFFRTCSKPKINQVGPAILYS